MISQRAQLTFSLIDASDSIGNMSSWLKDGVDLATAYAAGATFRGLVEPCTDAIFTRQAVVISAVESPKPSASSGADNTRVGVLIFSHDPSDLSDSSEFGVIEIPGLLESLLVATGTGAGLQIDQAAPAIIALVAELTSGLWCNPFGYALVALESAYLQIRR